MVEHSVIIDILKHKGFGEKWCSWIKLLLESGVSSVMLNGVPDNYFKCKRGVRQGDPLSPLLFVMVADFLQSILNDALQQGFIQCPVPVNYTNDFPIIQYAEDTLIILPAEIDQLTHLKLILDEFAISTGPRVNYHKSNIYPINVGTDKLHLLVSALNCQEGIFPFTYLGLPLGLSKPRMEHLLPLVTKVERKLLVCSQFLGTAACWEA
jgi:hypothetical protein